MSSGDRYILSLNAGSSSLKISLYSFPENDGQGHKGNIPLEPISLVLNASITNISSPPAHFSFKSAEPEPTSEADVDNSSDAITDHASAFHRFIQVLESKSKIDRKKIVYICHRVVHGGDYSHPIVITKSSYNHIEKLSDLAPLHNGAALSVIKVCMSALPEAKSIAYFDTSFHSSIPLHISSYAIDQDIAKKRGLKKYGFHGLSYSFILRAVSRFLHKAPEDLNLIVLHLGSGASACAIKNGHSVDTSMGLTPLNGLPGATRSGSIDPSLIFHYTNKAGRMSHDPNAATNVPVTMAEDILNRKAGWRAIAGTTDFGVITARAELADPDPAVATRNPHRLAFDLFVDRILQYVGGYHVTLGGAVDALVFAGGIGERGVELRATIAQRVQCLGYQKIDTEKNKGVGKGESVVVEDISIGADDGAVRAQRMLVCKTDEQVEMARQCALDPGFWNGNGHKK